jgi:hypothetical protein
VHGDCRSRCMWTAEAASFGTAATSFERGRGTCLPDRVTAAGAGPRLWGFCAWADAAVACIRQRFCGCGWLGQRPHVCMHTCLAAKAAAADVLMWGIWVSFILFLLEALLKRCSCRQPRRACAVGRPGQQVKEECQTALRMQLLCIA